MTVREAARYLEVSVFTVYKLCERSLLAHHRVGTRRGTIRLRREDLDAYLESRRVEVRPAEEPATRTSPRGTRREPVRDYVGEEIAKMREREQVKKGSIKA